MVIFRPQALLLRIVLFSPACNRVMAPSVSYHSQSKAGGDRVPLSQQQQHQAQAALACVHILPVIILAAFGFPVSVLLLK